MGMASVSPADTLSRGFVSALLFGGILMATLAGAQPIGVCYGMLGNNLPPPDEVVDLYKSMKIGRMRIYNPNNATLDALRGSNIQLTVGVPNDQLRRMASEPSFADSWVDAHVRRFWPAVLIRYIVVGNEVIPASEAQSALGTQAQFVLPAMQNIANALARAGLAQQIKVSTAINTAVLGNSYPPSSGAFSSTAAQHLNPILRFLNDSQSPLLANVYPYFGYVSNPDNMSLQYALFTAPSPVVFDGLFQYQNLFDAMVDSLYAAVEKVVGSGLEIVISESGWPSAGGFAATVGNAQTYNSNLIRHVRGGTPKRPGRAIETYIFAMFNENLKSGNAIGPNFGLFNSNKKPVYDINSWPKIQDNGLGLFSSSIIIISDVASI